ncbi:MAG TPA: hypothetical protein VKZ18_03530 [Polyangia bacterium]|nr:hypothetical protein [Polyangia bacterium]
MPSSEPEDQPRPPLQSATGEPSGPQQEESKQETKEDARDATKDAAADVGNGASTTAAAEEKAPGAAEPVWPPVEARPDDAPPVEPASGAPEAEAVLTKPDEPAAAKPVELAAEPKQEMGLSESTLHWLVDGERPVEQLSGDPSTAPHYDPSAPVAGRRRTIAIIGGAAILAVIVAAVLHTQAAGQRAVTEATTVEPAAVLTKRAETALAAGRSGEAMDLAHLAIVADPRFADAYAVEGKVQRDSGRLAEARDAYRKYLELAPIGTHAEEARQALAALPP